MNVYLQEIFDISLSEFSTTIVASSSVATTTPLKKTPIWLSKILPKIFQRFPEGIHSSIYMDPETDNLHKINSLKKTNSVVHDVDNHYIGQTNLIMVWM